MLTSVQSQTEKLRSWKAEKLPEINFKINEVSKKKMFGHNWTFFKNSLNDLQEWYLVINSSMPIPNEPFLLNIFISPMKKWQGNFPDTVTYIHFLLESEVKIKH